MDGRTHGRTHKVIAINPLAGFNEHTMFLFKQFHILPWVNMYDYLLGNFMYWQINNLSPVTIIIPEIQYNRDIHTYNTGNALQPHTQCYRKGIYWLSIPEHIRPINKTNQ